MSMPYLIIHKVRGEPAFDIATKMQCPECNGHGDRNIADGVFIPCTECDEEGYWWIVTTSGHRAYAWRWWLLKDLHGEGSDVIWPSGEFANGVLDSLPDHYPTSTAPSRPSLADLIPKPTEPTIRRRA